MDEAPGVLFHYSRNTMQTPAQTSGTTGTSIVDLEFIRNQAGLPDERGSQAVEAYHRAVFQHHHAAELERCQQRRRIHEDRVDYLESRLKRTWARLGEMEKLIPASVEGAPDVRPSSPWNAWDLGMFIAAAAGIVCLLIFGVLNVSFNLLESGLITFIDHPVRAYFWAALLPVGALAVKVGWDFLQHQSLRTAYLWTSLILGIAGVLVWVAAYASVYPTLSMSTEDHIASLSVFEDEGGAGRAADDLAWGGARQIDMTLVAAQAVAEIFLSAVLGIYMTMIYARHRPVRLAGNPLFSHLDEERRQLEERVEAERVALAEAKGGESRLESQRDAFVAFA
jgi:hypothetical protein